MLSLLRCNVFTFFLKIQKRDFLRFCFVSHVFSNYAWQQMTFTIYTIIVHESYPYCLMYL